MGFKFNPLTGRLDLVNPASGGMSIGGSVTSGTAKSVLFVDGSGNLAQDNSNFTYTSASKTLDINGPIRFGTGAYFIGNTSNGFVINNHADTLNLVQFYPSGGGAVGQNYANNGNDPGANNFIVQGLVGIGNPAPGVLLDIGLAGTTKGVLRLAGNTSGNVTIQPAAVAGAWSMTLPTSGGTSGYFLQTNGSGGTTWAAVSGGGSMAIGGAIGSSTAGSVLYVDGSNNLAQDNANFFWDATNHRLGLGTTSPSQQLQLTGNLRLVESTTTAGLIYQGTNLLLHTYAGTAGIVNTFLGVGAGNLTNTSGGGSGRNTGIGKNALHALADGYQNTVLGENAGKGITDGISNTLIGYRAGENITTGVQNTAVGNQALFAVSTGGNNNAFGVGALSAVTSGGSNAAFGYGANGSVTTGSLNVGVGDNTLNGLTTGDSNTVVGAESLKGGSGMHHNSVLGQAAMVRTTTAAYNVAIGMNAMYGLTTGTHNVAVGFSASSTYYDITTAHDNTFIGDQSGFTTNSQYNYSTAIGSNAAVNASNALVLGGPDTGTFEVNAGIGIDVPTARLHLPPGRAAVNKAPLKFTAGTLLTTPEVGTLEFTDDGTTGHLYITIRTATVVTRLQLA